MRRHDGAHVRVGIAPGRDKSYDAVISGTTITPERERVALFSAPYLQFDQGLAVNVRRNPRIKSSDDLRGLVVGIQVGNTSGLVARRLLAGGAIRDIKYYPYHGIITALDDLYAGRIGALIKLFPVISWLVKDRGEIEWSETTALGAVSHGGPAHAITFEETAAGASLDWHKVPHRQYVITLSGRLEFETRTGRKQTVEPGDILLAEDTAGASSTINHGAEPTSPYRRAVHGANRAVSFLSLADS